MPQLRATFFFKDSGGYGWSETIHSTKPDLTACLAAASSLAAFRISCLGGTSYLPFVRVSDDEVKRDSLIFKVPPGDMFNTSAAGTSSDIANTSLTVRLSSTPLRRRTLYMRGIPDDVVKNSGLYTPSQNFQGAFDQWFIQLKTDAWAIRGKSGVALPHTIGLIAQNGTSGDIAVTTLDPHGLAQNDTIVIRGVKGATALNGTWRVFHVTDTTNFTLKSQSILKIWTGQGTVTKQAMDLLNITDGEIMGVSHRIAGRPFDSHRGRRKATAKA